MIKDKTASVMKILVSRTADLSNEGVAETAKIIKNFCKILRENFDDVHILSIIKTGRLPTWVIAGIKSCSISKKSGKFKN